MKKLGILLLAGVGLVAFARRSGGRSKPHAKAEATAGIPPTSAQSSTSPSSRQSIDPGIVVHSPFNGDPGIVVRSPFNGDPGIVIKPAAPPDQPSQDGHEMV